MRYNIFKVNSIKLGVVSKLYERYEYGVEFKLVQGRGMMYFHDVRKWMVDTYGWSDQLGNAVSNMDNQYWAWTVNHDSYRIYLRSDKELMFFKLRFTNNDLV